MKKSLLTILLVIVIAATALTFVGCKKQQDGEQPAEDSYAVAIKSVTAPADTPEYMLKLEWLDASGAPTSFVKNKPVVVLFNGYSAHDKKDSYALDEANYAADGDVVNEKIKDFNRNTSFAWKKLGFNVGVFHYESFADDTQENLNKKVYNSSAMTYINTSGENKTAGGYNLTEAFIAAWNALDASGLDGSNGQTMMEVRFIGNGAGACLALSAADYLYALYDRGLIGAQYIPTRVDITNPYFSNDGSATVVEYRKEVTLGSALAYNSALVQKLAARGLVLDMVESDPDFYDSYASRYTGVQVTADAENEEIVTLGSEGDSGLYNKIKENCAYLNFSESFSTHYTEAYARYDRAALDWFLYSVGGSDTTLTTSNSEIGVISARPDGFRPILDGLNHQGVSYTANKYGVSAWTPTVYTRAIRGAEFVMEKYSASSSTPVTPFTMSEFQAEAYQKSDLNVDDNYAICGYVYWAKDNSDFVSLRADTALSGVSINVKVHESSASAEKVLETLNVTTASDGFYYCNLGARNIGRYATFTVTPKSKDYTFRTASVSGSEYQYANFKTSVIVSGGSQSMESASSSSVNPEFYLAIRNCGFNKAE